MKTMTVIGMLLIISTINIVYAEPNQFMGDAYHFTTQEKVHLWLKAFRYKLVNQHELGPPTPWDMMWIKLTEFPYVYQRDYWGCGPTVVESLSHYYGGNASQGEIVKRLSINPYYGMDWGSMRSELDRIGIQSSYTFRSREDFYNHLREGRLVVASDDAYSGRRLWHYVIVLGIVDGDVFLADTDGGWEIINLDTWYMSDKGLIEGAIAVGGF